MELFFQLFAGITFGAFGIYLLKESRRRGNMWWMPLGVVMLAFTYFVTNPWAAWGIGLGLCFTAYQVRNL